ncbi:hypothetical protein BC830DRAFT_883491 [Chytriomyces sp. MP71]|nr:hypothetical protein BC830DRAFT_883491 [Chytriomyces sp. MP71]
MIGPSPDTPQSSQKRGEDAMIIESVTRDDNGIITPVEEVQSTPSKKPLAPGKTFVHASFLSDETVSLLCDESDLDLTALHGNEGKRDIKSAEASTKLTASSQSAFVRFTGEAGNGLSSQHQFDYRHPVQSLPTFPSRPELLCHSVSSSPVPSSMVASRSATPTQFRETLSGRDSPGTIYMKDFCEATNEKCFPNVSKMALKQGLLMNLNSDFCQTYDHVKYECVVKGMVQFEQNQLDVSFALHPDITDCVWMILVHWMSEVCVENGFQNHTFFQAEANLKIFLTVIDSEINLTELQALGAAMLFISAKQEEPNCMDRIDFLEFARIPGTDEYVEDHVLLFEEFENSFCEIRMKHLLQRQWTVFDSFLFFCFNQNKNLNGNFVTEKHKAALQLLNMALLDRRSARFSCSSLAAAVMCFCDVVNKTSMWKYTGYTNANIIDAIEFLKNIYEEWLMEYPVFTGTDIMKHHGIPVSPEEVEKVWSNAGP